MIVRSNQQYNSACKALLEHTTFILPIPLADVVHPRDSSICVLYVYDIDDLISYMIPIDHPDVSVNFPLPLDITRAYTPSIKTAYALGISATELFDLELLYYFNSGKKLTLEKTAAHNFIERKFWKYPKNSQLVPILKLLEYCKNNRKTYIETIGNINSLSTEYIEYNRDITDVYSYLESSGINTTSGIEYTHYNLFTSTGRPSNTNNGINYAALNKDDGSRDRFVSRFENGMLVEFDFDAYHLRLISKLIGYDLPDGSVHEYLGKYYFGKDTLHLKNIKKQKNQFKILYGGIPKEFKNIEFFRLTGELLKNFGMSGSQKVT